MSPLTMDPNFCCPHKFSYRFGFHARPSSVGRFVRSSLYSRDHGRASKWTHEAYEFARLSPHATFPALPMHPKLFHALYANFSRHRRQHCLKKNSITNTEKKCPHVCTREHFFIEHLTNTYSYTVFTQYDALFTDD